MAIQPHAARILLTLWVSGCDRARGLIGCVLLRHSSAPESPCTRTSQQCRASGGGPESSWVSQGPWAPGSGGRRDGTASALSAPSVGADTEPHAWSDLRDHWQVRGGGNHPLTIIASCVAASEAMGRGVVEGLRRGREAILEGHSFSAAVTGTGISSRWKASRGNGAAASQPTGPEARRGLRGLFRSAEAQELALVMRVIDRLTAISALSERTGAPLARLLDRAAASFEDDAQVHSAVKAAVAGPRLTQLLLTALPLGGLLLGQLMGSGGIMVFVTSAWGPLCLVVGLILLALGYLWSARMIRSVRHEW